MRRLAIDGRKAAICSAHGCRNLLGARLTKGEGTKGGRRRNDKIHWFSATPGAFSADLVASALKALDNLHNISAKPAAK